MPPTAASHPAPPLPAPLLDADHALARILERHAFSTYLNPVNVPEARERFLRDGGEPDLQYQPLPDTDATLRELDALLSPVDHPLGGLIAASAAEVRAGVLALRDRTAAAFHAWNEVAGWLPTDADLEAPSIDEPEPEATPVETVTADQLALALRRALHARGWTSWEVQADPVMSARVLVDSPRRRVRVNPRARFRPADVRALIAHEIDVHVLRAENGLRQPLTIFGHGLARSLPAEEGLAIWAEAQVGTLTASARRGQHLIASAIRPAMDDSFGGLHRWLRAYTGQEGAWTLALRLKRGLAEPGGPGVYAKDSVYHVGYSRIRALVRAGDDLAPLFAGKVGLDTPVVPWTTEGWLTAPATLPAWWSPTTSPPG